MQIKTKLKTFENYKTVKSSLCSQEIEVCCSVLYDILCSANQNMRIKAIIQRIYVLFVLYLPVQSKSFVFVGYGASFEQANIFCKNKFPNGRLAIIKDEASKRALKSFLSIPNHPNLLDGKCSLKIWTLAQRRAMFVSQKEATICRF